MRPLEPGDRVAPSQKAIEGNVLTKNRDRKGTIVGRSRNVSCLNVLWDGTRTPQKLHREFLLRVLDEPPEVARDRARTRAGDPPPTNTAGIGKFGSQANPVAPPPDGAVDDYYWKVHPNARGQRHRGGKYTGPARWVCECPDPELDDIGECSRCHRPPRSVLEPRAARHHARVGTR